MRIGPPSARRFSGRSGLTTPTGGSNRASRRSVLRLPPRPRPSRIPALGCPDLCYRPLGALRSCLSHSEGSSQQRRKQTSPKGLIIRPVQQKNGAIEWNYGETKSGCGSGFNAFVLAMLAIDLRVFQRRREAYQCRSIPPSGVLAVELCDRPMNVDQAYKHGSDLAPASDAPGPHHSSSRIDSPTERKIDAQTNRRTAVRTHGEPRSALCLDLPADPPEPPGGSARPDPVPESPREVEVSLRRVYPSRGIRPLLERLQELADTSRFSVRRHEGMAVFVSPSTFRVVDLRRSVPELAVVADSFHIKPLVPPSPGRRAPYHVLCLNRQSVRLFEGEADHLEEIELVDVPSTLTEALGEEVTEPAPDRRLVQARLLGAPGSPRPAGLVPRPWLPERRDRRGLRAILPPHRRRDLSILAAVRPAAGTGGVAGAPRPIPRRQPQPLPGPGRRRVEPGSHLNSPARPRGMGEAGAPPSRSPRQAGR